MHDGPLEARAATAPYPGGMELWIWILLAVVIAALLVVIVTTMRAIRPKAPGPLDAGVAAPSLASPARPLSPRDPRPAPPAALTPAVTARIDALVAAEQRISAIKVLREASGLSLREAKDRIDTWTPSAPAVRPAVTPPYPQAGSASDALARLSPEVRAEIGRLVAADQKISAIKLLREATGLGLKDSKDAVDAWR
ncbi:Ribosomal protein L7/L12 [Microbacterium azadirachtae]|nr:Ribosomal protein L7/L12 [Microbacterium azadirachtae]SEG41012.1 Ribosomal protein L7/L12 [Microbacterium azadirachtae]SEG44023.1 Ribosomal protein L7/L12 [Microbacterium azadirachtae]